MPQKPSNPDRQNRLNCERLEQLLASKKLIPFHVDLPDKEYDFIKLSIYGAFETNELFVRVTNGKFTFVRVIDSPVLHPEMRDRIWGMDAEDSSVAFAEAESVWNEHAEVLKTR